MEHKTLVICYSQAGQTRKAVDYYLSCKGLAKERVDIINLAEDPAVGAHYPFPWSVFDFLRAQPEAFRGEMALERVEIPDLAPYERIVIAYPVWFLSPAIPMTAFLRHLPDNSFAGKSIVTLCTCRNMWVRAQLIIAGEIRRLGGRIEAHATLEDTAPSKVSLMTTLHYFITGKKEFDTPEKQRKYGMFGIKEAEYQAFLDWLSTAGEAEHPRAFFRFRESLVLAELIGRRISQFIYLPWELLRFLPKWVQNVYLAFGGVLTVVLILLLLPPTAIIGNLPPFRHFLNKTLHHLIDLATGFKVATQVNSL